MEFKIGNIILPTGETVNSKEIEGSINLSHLVNDLTEDYSVTYKLSIIKALESLGKYAKDALFSLKEILKNNGNSVVADQRRLGEASQSAIKVIESAIKKPDPPPTMGYGGYNNGYNNGYKNPGVSSSVSANKITVSKIVFEEINEDFEEGNKVYHRCSFCEKLTMVSPKQKQFSNFLASKFHCFFCLRSNYYQKTNHNVMILSYKGIIGYYYYSYFIAPKTTSSMYGTDIEEYVKKHIQVGLMNPVFNYDPDTFSWFIDFSKVSKKKIPIENIYKTIISQLAIFDLLENMPGISEKKFFDKIKDAVSQFYSKRTRVGNNNVFVPTFLDCDIPFIVNDVKPIPLELLQNFNPQNLDITWGNRSNKRW